MFLKPIHKNILLSVLAGLLAAFAFPKINLFFLMWIAFIPLFFVILRASPAASLFYAFIAGFVFNLQVNFWIIGTVMLFSGSSYLISAVFYIFFSAYFAVYWGIWGLFLSLAKKYSSNIPLLIIFSAALWVVLEYVRSYILGYWPWMMIAYSQYLFPQLIQFIEFTGVYGVSFAIMLINGLIYFAINDKKRNYIIAAAALLSAALIFGVLRYNAFRNFGDGNVLKAVAVQSNVEQYKKLTNERRTEMLAGLKEFAVKISEMDADLVVWCESEIINLIPADIESYAFADNLARIAGGFNIIGAPYIDENGNLYNTIFHFDGKGGYIAMHAKNHLVPFGEYMPFEDNFLRLLGIEPKKELSRGADTTVFTDGNLFVGPLICSENLFPDIVRRFVLSGAKVLTNHTNDAWFFDSSAPHKHFSANVFRAIESRKAIIVAANTGVSAFVYPNGKIKNETGVYERILISGPFMQNNYLTFYMLYGDIFIKLCILFIIIFILAVIYKKLLYKPRLTNKSRKNENETEL
ncbi:MAG: apolipoprotein N-acyltransferase [Endomicrobia bacterium]|nr:apolipoprotein N-acyltransferase [Endomicrobiia bacterium]